MSNNSSYNHNMYMLRNDYNLFRILVELFDTSDSLIGVNGASNARLTSDTDVNDTGDSR